MVLPTSAAVGLYADEVWTHGCALPDGGALASRRARAAACQVPKRKVASRARPSWREVRSGDVSRRVLGSISPRSCRSMSELDFREELVDIA